MENKLLSDLGILNRVNYEAMASRELSFSFVHMGHEDFKIKNLEHIFHKYAIKPPRTGHIGNWAHIMNGQAGALDFNKYIFDRDLGYPLLYCFTQTESLTSGDRVYRPGSKVENGQFIELPLYTWDGSTFAQRTRENTWFVPFVLTQANDRFMPLIQFHKERLSDPRFKFEAEILIKNIGKTKEILRVLLETAVLKNSRRSFLDLINSVVTKDGKVYRCEIRPERSGIWLNEVYFNSVEDIVSAAIWPLYAVVHPEKFFNKIDTVPDLMPILSPLLVGILSAVFESHRHTPGSGAVNVHLHWGARHMAGFTPKNNGYFSEKSTLRSHKWICDTLIREFSWVKPLCFVMLPASVFMLTPPHKKDAEILIPLYQQVSAGADVKASVQSSFARLSPYLRGRFQSLRETQLIKTEVELVPMDAVEELSFKQACGLVGEFSECLGEL